VAAAVALVAVAALPASAQLFRQHSVRYQTNDAGTIVLRGNVLTTCNSVSGTNFADCAAARAHTGLGTTGNLDNNDFSMIHVDVDGDPSTFNSSRTTLTVPTGASVLWAGLYWSGRTGNAQRNTMRFRTPASGGYVNITATQLDANGGDYQGFRDVTSLVQAGGSGQYTGANVFTTVSTNNQYAAWSLVVVLRNPALPLRNLTVFDGFANINTGTPVNVTVSGFLTPALGTPNTIVGIVTYEGDRGLTGDQMFVNSVAQSNAINDVNNFHNSTIADTTTYLTVGQLPAHTNQLGFDLKTFRTTNVPAGATSALLRFTSAGDQYYPGVVTFQTDLFNPVINGNVVKTVRDKNGNAITAVAPGDTLRYDMLVSNTGQDGSVNTVLIDTIPAGVTYVPGSIEIVTGSNIGAKTDLAADDQAEFLTSPARVRIRLGTGANATTGGNLAPSGSTRVRFRVRINDVTPSGFTINNQAYVTATSQTLGQPVNAASRDSAQTATTGPNGGTPPTPIPVVGPNLGITKAVAGDIPRGGTGSFTLTVRNIGTLASSATLPVVVTDTLVAGITATAASGTGWTCSIVGQVITCSRTGAIAAGGSAPPITVNVLAAVSAPPSFTNVAGVSGGGDNTPGDNTGSVNAVTTAVPDFNITKSVLSATPFVIGATAQYRIRVRNVGSAANTTDLEIRDTLAAGLSFASGTGTDFTCSNVGQAVTCTRLGANPVPVNDSVDVTLTVNVLAAAAPSVGNAARVFNSDDPNANNNRSVAPSAAVIADPDLAINKTAVGVFTVGQNATYRLRVRHVSPSPTAPSITVTDSLGAGLTFVAATGGGFACTAVGSVVTCSRGTAMVSGDSAIILMTVSVGTGALPNAYNKAWVVTAGDGNASNDTTVVAATQVAGVPDLSVTKVADAPLVIGQNRAFTITVSNVGTAATTDSIIVADTLPASLTFISATGPNFTCTFAAPVARCARATPLVAGAAATLTLTVQGTVAALPTITNRVTVATAGDADPSNNLFTLPGVAVVSVPDVSIAKTSTGPMTIGQPATYRLLVRNVSPGPTTGTITVQDSLAAGLTFTSATGTGFTCVAVGPLVTCTRPAALAAGDSVAITLTATPSGAIAASVPNLARVSTPGDVNAFNDTTVTAPRTVQRPNLGIAKSHTGNFTALDTLGTVVNTYSITLTNSGAAATTGTITVVDSLPAHVEFVGTPTGGWNCAAAGTFTPGRVVTCTNPGPIAAGGTANLVLQVTARPLSAGSVTNIARVSTADDADATNDRATDPTIITATPDLQLFKSNNRTTASTPVPFQVGAASQTFALEVTNVGAGATTGTITLRDTLPQGILFTSGTGTGFTCSAVDSLAGASPRRRIVECTRATALAAGAAVTVTLNVTVDASAVPSITNTAQVGTPGDVNPANDRATDATAPVVNALDLTITKVPQGAFTIGSNAIYEIGVTNLGTGTSTLATTVTDTLAPGLTFVSATGGSFSCSVTSTITGPPSRQVVTCTRPSGGPSATNGIQGSTTYTFDLTVTVGAGALPSQVNRVWVENANDPNTSNNSFLTGSVAIVSPIDLRLTKSPVGPIIAGSTAQFNFSLANLGASSTTGTITITDTLPVGLSLASSTGGGFGACTTTGTVVGPPVRNIIQCVRPAAPAMTAGETQLLTVTVNVAAAAFPSVQNRASVATTGDVNPANDTSSTAVLAVTSVPDFSLVKTGASPLSVGQSSNFTLTVANVSPVAPSGNTGAITLTDTLPVGFTFNAAATGANGSTAASLFTCTSTSIAGPRDVVTCTRAAPPGTVAMTQGQEVQVVIVTTVTAAAVGTITNTAWLSTAGDLNTGNNSSTTAVLAVVVPDLTVTKAVLPAALVRGQNGTYTITVTNGGTGPTTGDITLTDNLPAGLQFVSVAEPVWSCSASGAVATGQTVTCTQTAALAPSATSTATLTVSVTTATAGSVDNTVSVATPTELNTGNNSFTLAGTSVSSVPDVALASNALGTWTRNVPAQLQLVPTNVGTAPTTGTTTITTTLPAGVTFTGSTTPGWTCVPSGSTVSCSTTTAIAPSASLPVVLDLAIAGSTASTISVPSTVSSPGDANAANDAATSVVSVASAPDLQVTKTLVSSLIAGQGASYNIVVRNVGSAATTGPTTVTDTLASVLGYVLGTGGGFGCSASGTVVTCTRNASLAAGDSAVLVLNVNVQSVASGTVSNTARASTAGDPNPANDGGSTGALPVTTAPDLALSGSVAGPVTGGSPATVSFTPVNQGSAATSGTTTFTTTMPVGATFTSATGTGWSCSASGQVVTCTTTTPIAPGDSLPLALVITLPVAPPNPVSFPSTITTTGDPNTANNATNPSASVGAVPDAALAVSGVGQLIAGQPGTIRFTTSNVGGAATTDSLRLTTTLPPGVTFTGSSTPGWTCSAAGQVVTCRRLTPPEPALASGASTAVDLGVTLANTIVGVLPVSGTIQTPGDPNATNNLASASLSVLSVPDVQLTVSLPGAIVAGQPVAVRLSPVNVGSAATSGTQTTALTVPAGLTWNGVNPAGYTCSFTAPTLSCSTTTPIAPNDSLPFTVTLAVPSTQAAGTLAFPATATVPGDANTGNNNGSASGPVTFAPDLALGSSVVGTLTAGQPGTLRFAPRNVGSAATSANTTVAVTLPTGVTWNGTNPVGYTCSFSTPTLSCVTTTPIAVGDSLPFTVGVAVAPSATGSLSIPAVVTVSGDPNATNNTTPLTVTPASAPDMALGGTVVGAVTAGQPMQVRYAPRNVGSAAAPGTSVAITVPADLTWNGTSPAGYTCTLASPTLTCVTTTSIAAGDSLPFTLGFATTPTLSGTVTVPATATTTGDPNTTNDAASPNATVGTAPDIALTGTVVGGPIVAGQPATITFIPTNTGSAAAPGTSVAITLPTGVTWNGTNPAGYTCTFATPTLTCATTTPIAPAAALPFTIGVTTVTTLTGPVNFPATATTTGDPNATNDAATASSPVTTAPDIAVTAAFGGAVVAGQPTTLTVTPTNVGSASAAGTSVAVTLPTGVTWNGTSPAGYTCTVLASVVTCATSTAIAGSASLPFTLGLNTSATLTGPLTVPATATTTGDPNATNNTGTATAVVGTAPDVALSGTVVGPLVAGQTTTVRFAPVNVGSASAPGTSVAITLPSGVTWPGTSPAGYTCSVAASVLTCSTATAIAASDSLPFTVTLAVSSAATGTLSFPATATTTGDPNTTNDTASPSATVGTAPDIALAGTVVGGPIVAGQPATLTFTPTNNGSAAAPGTSVAITLPTGVTWNGTSPAGYTCTFATPTLTCATTTPIAPAASLPFTIGVTTATTLTGPASFPATATTTGDPNTTNNSATPSSPVTTAPDITLTGTAGPFVAGQPGTIRFVPRNVGSAATTGTMPVVITLPTGTTWNGTNPPGYTCALAGLTLTCSTTTAIAPGDSLPFTVGVTVPLGAPATVSFPATATAPGDPNPGNNSTTPTGVVNIAADLSVGVSAVGPFVVAQPGTLRLVTRNVGGAATTGTTTLTTTLPPGLTFSTSSTPAGWSCSAAGQVVTCSTSNTIAAADSAVLTLGVGIGAAAAPNAIVPVTVAMPGDVNASNDAASATIPVTTAPDLTLTSTTPGPLVVGRTGTTTTTGTNRGSAPTSGPTTITTTLPTGTTFTGATGPGFTCTVAGQVVTCTNPATVPVGDSVGVVITYTVGPTALPGITIPTTVGTAGDANPGNNGSGSTVPVIVAPDLTMTKAAVGTFTVGQPATYTLTVTNSGSGATTGPITVLDSLPATLTFTSATGPDFSCTVNGRVVTCTRTTPLAPSAAVVVSVVTVPTEAALPQVVNVARASTPGDPDPANDRGQVTTPVGGNINLAITKTGADTIAVGANATWTIGVRNAGSLTIPAPITVIDSLPVGITFGSASGAGWSCSQAAGVVTCTRGTSLAPGATAPFNIQGTVGVGAFPAVTNRVRANVPSDADTTDNRATKGSVVTGTVDLELRKTAPQTALTAGLPGTFLLTVANRGTIPTQGPVTITDSLPAGLTYASGTGTGWTCSAVAQVVTCGRPTPLANGDSSLVTVNVAVGPLASGSLTNVAVAATPLETNTTNNRGTATVQVTGEYRLAVEKTSAGQAVSVGGTNDYTIVVRNIGASPVPDVRVSDRLPRGFLLVPGSTRVDGTASSDPAGAPAPLLTFTLGTIAPGAERRITYRTRITAQVAEGRSVNTATASSGLLGLTVSANNAAAPVQVRRSVFSDRGVVVGKVFAQCDCGPSSLQTAGELGVPGVRVVMEDGTSAITDAEGKYNFWDVASGLHVVRVDVTTLPAGARLVTLGNRNAGDGASRFVDLKQGELHRADFALASDADAYAAVKQRRRAGEPAAAIVPRPLADSLSAIAAALTPTAGGDASLPPTTPVVGDTPVSGEAGAIAGVASAAGTGILAPAGAVLPPLTDATSNLPMTPLRARQRLATGSSGTAAGRIEIATGRLNHPADGVSRIPVRVRVLDGTGQPVKGRTVALLETSLGAWIGTGPLDQTQTGPQVVLNDGVGEFQLSAPGTPGLGEIRVTTNAAEGTIPVRFVPAARPLFLVGLLQGRLDRRVFERGDVASGTGDRFERMLTAASFGGDTGQTRGGVRGAVYAKGTVLTDKLLTLGWDSERNPDRSQFRDIDPDLMFPTYGDASLREFDAQARQRFYARLDDGRSFTRVGDFQTQRAGEARQLGAWDRSLTGFQHHAENDRGVANVYAARTGIRQFVEELPGRGLSGPYLLGRLPLVNSERVELITRDRNQPSLILRQRPMQRFADYIQESGTNRIVFRVPVPSLDEQFNPVSVRVTYEVEQIGEQFTTAGADAQVRFGRLELGGVVAIDQNPTDSLQLFGGNASLRLGENTVALAELAQTRTAGGIVGEAGRAEVRHAGKNVEWRLFAVRTGAAFLNRSAALGIGRQEFGGRMSTSLGLGTRLVAEALQTEDLLTGGRRRGASVGLERRLTGWMRVEGGMRFADETAVPASPTSIGLVPPPNFTAYRARVTLQPMSKASFFGELERGTTGDVSRWSTGAEYQLPGRARLYARHEELDGFGGPFALARGQRQSNTVLGVDADVIKNSQIFSEYRARDAFSGRDAEASMGLRNRWALAQGLLVNTSFERVAPVVTGSTPSRRQMAIAGAFEWTKLESTKLNGRGEVRGGNGRSWLGSFGLAQKVSRDWTFLARSLYDESPLQQTERWRSHAGFAWRQTDANRFNALFRYEHLRDRTGAGAAVAAGTATERHLLHALANVQATSRMTLTGRVAAQWQDLASDGLETSSQSQLLYGRALYDVTRSWDVGLISSVVLSEGLQQRQLNFGFELGRLVAQNARLAVGWNTHGYSDRIANAFGYTTRGVYLDFGFKFDESLFAPRPKAAPRPSGGNP
jgi:uncharacterized repeat protein (TIGR01451 family)